MFRRKKLWGGEGITQNARRESCKEERAIHMENEQDIRKRDADDQIESGVDSLDDFLDKLKKKLFLNKRLWGYVLFYFVVFGATYKYCDPWYGILKRGDKMKEFQDALMQNLSADARDYDVVGNNGHRPGEMMIALINSIICSVKSFEFCKYDKRAIFQSFGMTNNAKENECFDIHVAFWLTCTLLWFKKPNKLILLVHHLLGTLKGNMIAIYFF
ncbi:hypothetical protein RFI_16793 [Reticulomyxa filosa]|uniref:Uncharacterized protein n=1 Tax=Reticulomyxa filosa TaxID=46433 RepID=X6N3H7_RETFI|nr:hypothetical protein RFI_16793 [Reticulomyxa filosa]|eukprot:ETO20423.1 hypothetical protein RFI_16793 [Reticulomyxa filosa]